MKEIIANPAIRLRTERTRKESYRGLKRVYPARIVGLDRFFGARPKPLMEQKLSRLGTDTFKELTRLRFSLETALRGMESEVWPDYQTGEYSEKWQ